MNSVQPMIPHLREAVRQTKLIAEAAGIEGRVRLGFFLMTPEEEGALIYPKEIVASFDAEPFIADLVKLVGDEDEAGREATERLRVLQQAGLASPFEERQ